ncbi:hypothetical protein PVA45_06950 [Entomospira entomophila]|uniref:Uncharacterized protein n=1 Tax=Entomospira entomophila TaxID=2719988 RepID=A0A968GF04_9SPIO|nr:hypothetical protein [Entomospira entomophilus]NIZ41239.1 hypothetical protein [Entomospira entomophilus]WDI35444.1 hypothetical protein PVA45_06950 [Entomospira entomophilus]
MIRIFLFALLALLVVIGRELYFYYKPLSKKLPRITDADSIKEIPTEILHQSIKIEADENDQNRIQYTYHLSRHIWLSKYLPSHSLNVDSKPYYTLTWSKYYKQAMHKQDLALPVRITCIDSNHQTRYEAFIDITSVDLSIEKESYYIFPSVIFFWPETTYKVQTSVRIPNLLVEHLLSSSLLRITPNGQKPIELKNIAFDRQQYWIKVLSLMNEAFNPIL